MIFKLLALILLSLGAQADNLCQYNSIDKSLVTPNGTLYMNFAPHRSRDELELFETILDNPSEVTPDVIPELEAMLKRLEPIMQLNAQWTEVRKLQKLVSLGKIDWIGVEFSQKELDALDDHNRSALERFNTVRALLSKAGAKSETVDSMLLLFSASAGRYVYFLDASVRANTRLLALDSEDLKSKGLGLLEENRFRREAMNIFVQARPDLKEKVDQATAKLDALSKNGREFTDVEIESAVRDVNDKEFSDFLTKSYKGVREFWRVQRAREKWTVSTIVSQQGNGWISEGSQHEDIVPELSRLCKENLKTKGSSSRSIAR